MHKIVINSCFGGFDLSPEAEALYEQRSGKQFYSWSVARHDPTLVEVVEELGSERASGGCAKLTIEEIEGNQYTIDEYDGIESVITPDTINWITID